MPVQKWAIKQKLYILTQCYKTPSSLKRFLVRGKNSSGGKMPLPSLPSKAFCSQWKPISRHFDPVTASGPQGIGLTSGIFTRSLTSQQQTLMNRSINHSHWTRVTNKPSKRSSTAVACMKKRPNHQTAMKQKTHQHMKLGGSRWSIIVHQRCFSFSPFLGSAFQSAKDLSALHR